MNKSNLTLLKLNYPTNQGFNTFSTNNSQISSDRKSNNSGT